MSEADRDFPDGFLWGSATAAHQVEGGNVNNDWWAWEHAPGTTAVEPSGDAIDHYHRFDDDFRLLAGLGQSAHRFSIEWSRIEPAPGEWSQAALDHYARVLESLARHGLTAFATLMHFTLPRWLAERGGWLAPGAVDVFGRFVEKVAGALGDLMPYACTVNEPQIVALHGYLLGYHPPGVHNPTLWRRAARTLVRAHETALDALTAGPSQRRDRPLAGVCLQLPALQPARAGDHGCITRWHELEHEMVDVYLDGLRGDYVGLQYHTRMRVDPAVPGGFGRPPDTAPLTQMGWELHPDGLRDRLHKAASTGLPVVVTENGIATGRDSDRVDYLETHLGAVAQAVREGVDVRGYLYRSSFDTFEWAEGYRPTSGLVGIDRADGLRRVVRPSAYAYGRVAHGNRLAALRDP